MVGQDPVHFLGHGPHVTAQAGLHVGDGDVELGRRQGAGQGGVRVAENDHRVGPLAQEHALHAREGAGGLVAVRAPVDPEVKARPGQPELRVVDLGHVAVVVLSGVDRPRPKRAVERAQERRRLHELRPRAHHQGQGLLHRPASRTRR